MVNVKWDDLPPDIREKFDPNEELEVEMLDEETRDLIEKELDFRKTARQKRAERLLKRTQVEVDALTKIIDTLEDKPNERRRAMKKAQRYHKSALFEVRMLDKEKNDGV